MSDTSNDNSEKIKAFILTLMEYHVFLAVANGNFITRKLKQLKRIIKLQQTL